MKTSFKLEKKNHFTYAWLEEFIHQLKLNQYRFVNFQEAIELQTTKPFIILRHDIDFDIEKALAMAKFEFENDIKSTYFILLRNDHYNIFSADSSQMVKMILSYGHYLGLHFDAALYPPDSTLAEWQEFCMKECRILEEWFDEKITAVSFHRPGKFILDGGAENFTKKIPHTYQHRFTKQIAYFSDSRGEWRYGNPMESQVFTAKENMQVLIHPLWWDTHTIDANEKLNRILKIKKKKLIQSFENNCVIFKLISL